MGLERDDSAGQRPPAQDVFLQLYVGILRDGKILSTHDRAFLASSCGLDPATTLPILDDYIRSEKGRTILRANGIEVGVQDREFHYDPLRYSGELYEHDAMEAYTSLAVELARKKGLLPPQEEILPAEIPPLTLSMLAVPALVSRTDTPQRNEPKENEDHEDEDPLAGLPVRVRLRLSDGDNRDLFMEPIDHQSQLDKESTRVGIVRAGFEALTTDLYPLFQSEVGTELRKYEDRGIIERLTAPDRPRQIMEPVLGPIEVGTGKYYMEFPRKPGRRIPGLDLTYKFGAEYDPSYMKRRGIEIVSMNMNVTTQYDRDHDHPNLIIKYDGGNSPRVSEMAFTLPVGVDKHRIYLLQMNQGSALSNFIKKHCVLSAIDYPSMQVLVKLDKNKIPSLHIIQEYAYYSEHNTHLYYIYEFDKGLNRFVARPIHQPNANFRQQNPNLTYSDPVTNPATMKVSEFFRIVDDLTNLIDAEQLQEVAKE